MKKFLKKRQAEHSTLRSLNASEIEKVAGGYCYYDCMVGSDGNGVCVYKCVTRG